MCTREAWPEGWPPPGPHHGWALRDAFLVQALIKYMAKYNGRAAPYTEATIKALGLPLEMILQATPGMYIFEMFIHGSMILVMQRCSTGSVVANKLIQDYSVMDAHFVKRRVQNGRLHTQAPCKAPPLVLSPGPHALGALCWPLG